VESGDGARGWSKEASDRWMAPGVGRRKRGIERSMRRSIEVMKSTRVSVDKQKTDSRMEGGELVVEVRELRKVMVEMILVLRRLVRGMEKRGEVDRESEGAEVKMEREGAGEEGKEEDERREKEDGGGREEGRKVVEELKLGKGNTIAGRKETREKKAEGKRAKDGERKSKWSEGEVGRRGVNEEERRRRQGMEKGKKGSGGRRSGRGRREKEGTGGR